MLEILQDFEQAAPKLAPLVVILPGLAVVVAGLFLWLGGLGFRRLLAGLVGASAGAICGFFLIRRNIASVALAAGIAALVAIIFNRVFIVILAVALAVAFGFAVLAWPYLQTAGPEPLKSQAEITPGSQPATVSQSIETLKRYAVDFGHTVKSVGSRMPFYSWVILAAVAAVFAVVGIHLWRLICALCCAALGTTLIFAGMILLLSYKGSAPITKISGGSSIYAAIFLGMIVFGTFEQWLLCGRQKRQPVKAKKDKSEPEQESRSWRTS